MVKKTYCVATALIKNKDKYLILKRATSKKIKPGLWEFVTGFVEDHESAEDTIIREIKEEIEASGTIIESLDPFQIEESSERWIIVPYLVELVDLDLKISPEEHTEERWITVNEFDDIPQKYFRYDKTKIKRILVEHV